jgi:rhamnosyltransferase
MPDSLKIAGVVILYHPSEDVVSNIKTYYDWLDKIYVFDNTKGDSYVKGTLEGLSKIEFFQNGDNYGIAKNLNKAVRFAIKENFDWMLTMDQDTIFQKMLSRITLGVFITMQIRKWWPCLEHLMLILKKM